MQKQNLLWHPNATTDKATISLLFHRLNLYKARDKASEALQYTVCFFLKPVAKCSPTENALST